MGITDTERTELFTRLGKIEGKVSNPHNGNGAAKTFAGVLVIVSIIGGMTAIVRPMQQQIDYIKDAHELYKVENTRERNQFMRLYNKTHEVAQERINARFVKLEEWQRYMYRDIVPQHGSQSGRIDAIEKELERINDLFKIREENVKRIMENKK